MLGLGFKPRSRWPSKRIFSYHCSALSGAGFPRHDWRWLSESLKENSWSMWWYGNCSSLHSAFTVAPAIKQSAMVGLQLECVKFQVLSSLQRGTLCSSVSFSRTEPTQDTHLHIGLGWEGSWRAPCDSGGHKVSSAVSHFIGWETGSKRLLSRITWLINNELKFKDDVSWVNV